MLFALVKKFKESIVTHIPHLPINLLFTWLGVKLMTLAHVWLPFKILGGVLLIILFAFFWQSLFTIIMNNVYFQLYLYGFYRLINECLQSYYYPFCLGLSLGFIPYFFEIIIEIGSLTLILPNIEVWLVIYWFFYFFRRFNNSLIIPAITKGLPTAIVGKSNLCWQDILNCIMATLSFDCFVKDKLLWNSSTFSKFPFPDDSFSLLVVIGLNKDIDMSLDFLKNHKQKVLEMDENEILREKKLLLKVSELLNFCDKKSSICKKAGEEASKLNTAFFWQVLGGFLLTTFILFLNLNFLVLEGFF